MTISELSPSSALSRRHCRFAVPCSTAGLLALAFAALYIAVGPGCFFSVDEVVVQESAQSLLHRGTLEVPPIPTSRPGRGGAFYAHRGPALTYVAVPFVALGNFLDDHFGSIKGGVAAGPALGVLEHPLRWGGRLAVFTASCVNGVIGGLSLGVLFLICVRLSGNEHVALMVTLASGFSTLLVSEATHFFGHPLEVLTLLLAFWFLSGSGAESLARRAWLGGLCIGLAFMARPNSAPAGAIIWAYGAWRIWKEGRHKPHGWLIPVLSSMVPAALCVVAYLLYNRVQFGSVTQFGYNAPSERFALDFSMALRAIAAYLVSPSLSVFLFAPPLLLALPVLRDSSRRWPAETAVLLSASSSELLVLAFYRSWHGELAYGPRFMLAAIMLLMPLTIPAFEHALTKGRYVWRIAIAVLVAAGFFVQVVAISVYVTTNQWYRAQHHISEGGAWAFVFEASPVLVQLRDLLANRNLGLWALRALHSPGWTLAFLVFLVAVAAAATLELLRRHVFMRRNISAQHIVAPERRSYLAEGTVAILGLLVLAGFARSRPVLQVSQQRTLQMLNEGMSAQKIGRDVTAEENYALALGLEPNDKFALYNLALLYQKAGSLSQAVTLYQRALQQDASWADAYNNMATAYNGLANWDEAIRAEQAAIRLKPDFQLARNNLAWSLAEKNRHMDSLAEAEAEAKRAPAPEKYLNLSLQYHRAGRYQDSIVACREALNLKPDYADAYNNMAAAYNALANWDEAIRAEQEAIRLNPDFQLARGNLNWSLAQKRRQLDNLASGQAEAKRAPTPEKYLSLSLEYYRAGRYQDVITASRQALKLRPDYAEAYNNIAAAYEGMGRWDEAIDAAQQALRLKPDFQLARNNLAYSLTQKRMKELANAGK